jgi:glycosyltransferase involved in cell wall biosynthesis
MKFMFGTAFYKPAAGGGGPIHSVSSLAESLVRRGHDVTVAASDRDIPGVLDVDTSCEHIVDGVKVRYFRSRPTWLQRTGIPMFARSGAFAFGAEFDDWLSRAGHDIDVFHSHISFLCTNGPMSLAARRHDRIYLYHQRGNLDPVRLRRGWLKKQVFNLLVEKPVMRRAHALIALNEYERASYRALGLTNRVAVIPNGIDPNFCESKSRVASNELEAVFRRAEGRIVFLFLSRIHPMKGPDLFIDAFIRCAVEGLPVHALLAGPDESGMVTDLKQRVRMAGVQDRFDYLGTVQGEGRLSVLKRADVFVLPTASEGMSMAILEALASGCAVLTCPGAYFDDIIHSGAGWIVDRSVQALQVAFRACVTEGASGLAVRGERARKLVRDQYTWPSIADRYEQLVYELIAARKGCAARTNLQ